MPLFLRNNWASQLTDALSWLIYLNLGFFSLVFVGAIVKDLASFLLMLLHRAIKHPRKNIANPDRRELFKYSLNAGIIGISGTLTHSGVKQATQGLIDKTVTIPIANLPKALESLRIVQFTDLHVGPTIKIDYVEEVVARIQSLRPDVIVMTGDLVDGSVKHLENDVEPLRNLTAASGKFFITGNHEYHSGVEAWMDKIRDLGFIILLNEHRLFSFQGEPWLLAGVPDYHAERYFRHINPIRPKPFTAHRVWR